MVEAPSSEIVNNGHKRQPGVSKRGTGMPIVQVQILEGRSEEQRRNLIQEITEACHRTVDVKREAVRVSIIEVSNTNFGVGGKTLKELGR